MIVIEEKNGYKLGINDNPDVAHLPEERRYQIQYPDGDRFSGNETTIRKQFAKITE
jgi:hypothetical protein